MTDYIILEYEHLYHKMMEHEMKLPDAVLTFKLLDGANITDDERKLALTVCNDLNFDRMKSALKRLFSKAPLNPSNENFKNKQEEAYYNKKHKDFKHPKSNEKFKQFGKLNPVDKNGKISRCVICDSKLHWAPKHPHRNDQNVNILEDSDSDSAENHSFEEVNIVLITEDLSKSEIFFTEASKSAVIDTACTKTVAGEQWLSNFMSSLTTRSKNEIKCYPSSTKFKFGDGRQVTAIKRIIFPIAGNIVK